MKQRRHIVIPDLQVRPGVPVNHIPAIGRYIAEWRPEVIVQLGDMWDFPSLSTYEEGTLSAEGKDVKADIDVGNAALAALTQEILRPKGYKPRRVLLRGNHEDRLTRAAQQNPRMAGLLSFKNLRDRELGWEVHPFLKPVVINGISYCHYFCRSATGGVVNAKRGAPSARAQVQREMMSCTAGHKQGIDTHVQAVQKKIIRGIIAGSAYQHEEEYLTPQGSAYWRGILVKHEVHDGMYDLMEVSLSYLLRKYA